MANSGSVRIKFPEGVVVQVGVNAGNVVGTPQQLAAAGGGNVFSAWVVNPSIDVDTVFYLTNHTDQDVQVDMKWLNSAGVPLSDTPVPVVAHGMAQAPASAFVGG